MFTRRTIHIVAGMLFTVISLTGWSTGEQWSTEPISKMLNLFHQHDVNLSVNEGAELDRESENIGKKSSEMEHSSNPDIDTIDMFIYDTIKSTINDPKQGKSKRLLQAAYDSDYNRSSNTETAETGLNPDIFNNGSDFNSWISNIMEKVKRRMEEKGFSADPVAIDERPSKNNDNDNLIDSNEKHHNQPYTNHKEVDQNKPTPLIVMSGNTYIKDIGNHQTALRFKQSDNNKEKSALLKLLRRMSTHYISENSKTHKPKNARKKRTHERGENRDGVLTNFREVHGHDDGDGGVSKTFHEVHGHDDGESGVPRSFHVVHDHKNGNRFPENINRVHGHNDGDNGASKDIHKVHGHNDGDNGASKDIHKVHGHNDGDNGASKDIHKVHGHNDGDNGASKDIHKIHGHNDGDNGASKDIHKVHGHNNGDNDASKDIHTVHGHNDGDNSASKDIHTVHGHNDGDNDASKDIHTVHGHNDGDNGASKDIHKVHGHNDGDNSVDNQNNDENSRKLTESYEIFEKNPVIRSKSNQWSSTRPLPGKPSSTKSKDTGGQWRTWAAITTGSIAIVCLLGVATTLIAVCYTRSWKQRSEYFELI